MLVHPCETPGCDTLTMGRLCVRCEKELGIEFPRFVWVPVPTPSMTADAARDERALAGFATAG